MSCVAKSLLLAVMSAGAAWAQTSQEPATEAVKVEQVARVPGMGTFFRGLNAGVTFAAAHDSAIGWYELVTPAVSYTVSPHLSVDVSLSIYPNRLAQVENAAGNTRLVTTHGDLGDTYFSLHGYFALHALQNTATVSLTAPTGNTTDGLGTGRVTFDLRDHVERYFGQTGALVDLGGGDSSGLFNRLVNNEYSSLGPIAHFQAGLIHWFPGRMYLESLAYEQLPLGDQKIYETVGMPPRPPQTIVIGRRVIEDNGFTTAAGVPLTSQVTLSGYYNRSLRLHLDTVGMAVTFVFRGTPIHRGMSMIDRAIREAEGATP